MVVMEQRRDEEESANGKWPGSQLRVEPWGECGKDDRTLCKFSLSGYIQPLKKSGGEDKAEQGLGAQ